jgi:hypothetical protein
MNALANQFYQRLDALYQASSMLQWPSRRYEHDIEGFAFDILGIRFFKKQREFALLLQEEDRVAVKAGQKVAKTLTLIIKALHHYTMWDDSQTYLTAPGFGQVEDVLWKQLTLLVSQSGICYNCKQKGVKQVPCPHSCKIDGKLAIDPHTGLKAGNRAIIGLAVNDPDCMSGRSGAHVQYILDEVIGIKPNVFEAVIGALAGGASLYIASNPTESDPNNEFYKAFHSLSNLYHTLTISSYDSPNVTGEFHVKGCAELKWIEEQKERWGEDSMAWMGRILGEFPLRSTDTILTPDDVKLAQLEWNERIDPAGILAMGIDVAGQSMGNDSWSFAVRRGRKIVELVKVEGFDSASGIEQLDQLLESHRVNDECPQVAFDGSSYMGSQFAIALSDYSRKHPGTVAPRRLQPSGASPNDRFFRLRDFLIWNMADQIIKGLGIPPDLLLEEELLALRWDLNKADSSGLDKVIDKKILRKILKRSPDLSDAVSYALFGIERDGQPRISPAELALKKKQAEARGNPHNRIGALNPFAGHPQYRRR